MEDGRKLDVGHVLQHPDGQLEVTSVRYQGGNDGEARHSFEYTLQHKEEVDAAREAQKVQEEETAELEAREANDTPALG